MSRKGQSMTLSVSERDKAALEKLALEWGYLWGDRPNISKLVEAIARQKLAIASNHDWSLSRIEALLTSFRTLIDAGKIEAAMAIANLLLERSELSLPLRGEIEGFLGNPPPPWRLEINRYIKRQKPFQLSYQDAMGRLWHFTVRHAQINHHEQRQYLDCWCDETEGNLDVEELKHNWSLRLDRIPEAAIMSVAGKWRPQLDRLDVEIHLSGRLAFAYPVKPEDNSNEWLSQNPPRRKIIRPISSTYWFVREVLQNAPDMVIVSPEKVRSRLLGKLKTLQEQYNVSS